MSGIVEPRVQINRLRLLEEVLGCYSTLAMTPYCFKFVVVLVAEAYASECISRRSKKCEYFYSYWVNILLSKGPGVFHNNVMGYSCLLNSIIL